MTAGFTPSDATAFQDLQSFVALEERARAAETVVELAFILANETISLLHFSQAAVLDCDGKVLCLSGVSLPDERSPFSLFLRRLANSLSPDSGKPLKIDRDGLPRALAEDWDEWLAPCAVWMSPTSIGWGMLMAREEPFTDAD